MIKAVLFDLDGTLLNRDASLRSFAEDQYERFAEFFQPIPKQQYMERFITLDNRGYTWKDKVYEQLIQEFELHSISAENLLQDYISNFKLHCMAFPNLHEMLGQLKAQGYQMGIITNGKGQFQMDNIIALGIEQVMDTILVSEWEGISKPNPLIFERACAKLGVAATECVFIGDHPENDVLAAKDMGMVGVWKVDTHWERPNADYLVNDLLEIPDLLRRLFNNQTNLLR